MGIKEQSLLEYTDDPVRYADLINGSLFHGQQIVQSEYLKPVQRKKTLFPGSDKQRGNRLQRIKSSQRDVQYFERERDRLMLHAHPKRKCYVGCEGQSQPDYEMPARNFAYDGVEYSDQLKARKYVNGEKGEKRKSRRPLVPVFHLVIYLGEKRWLSKHSLREMLDIPEELREFQNLLPDYQIHLMDIHNQNPELFRTEWKDIFRLMNHSRKKEELKEYIEKNQEEIRKLSIETRYFLAVLLDQYEILEDGSVEVKDVCDAWNGAMQLYREEGVKVGIQALILDNLEEGRDKSIIVSKLQKRFSLSLKAAEEYYNCFTSE